MCAWFFFLQAEDGIRDGHVTGVQTCALPIWVYQIPNYSTTVKEFSGTYVSQSSGNIFQQASYGSPWNMYNDDLITISEKIGRASCRETNERRVRAETEEEDKMRE